MIKIVASHSMKVPAEGEYSSKSFHVGLEAEIAETAGGEGILARTRELFALAKAAVNSELSQPSKEPPKPSPTPTETRDAPARTSANGFRGTNGNGDTPASSKQLNFLLSLAKKHWGYPKLEAVLRDEFHVQGPENLTKRQCSDLIERMNGGAHARR